MKIAITELTRHLHLAWMRVVSSQDAVYATDAIVYAVLSKDKRMNPLREALDDITSSISIPPQFRCSSDKSTSRVLDFGGSCPFGKMRELHDWSRTTAQKFGISAQALRNTSGIHTLSSWVEPLLRGKDIIALFAWNGGSYTVAPFGSREPFFGTNPIAYAIPTDDGSILCDMATSEVPFMSLRQALRTGETFPQEVGLNENGTRTAVPSEIYDVETDSPVRLLPMGFGYKGSAIMLAIEILTGALIDAKMGREATDVRFVPEEFGGWLIAFDIASFSDPVAFRSRVGALKRQIKMSSMAVGTESITLPGDRSDASYKANVAVGTIEIPDADWDRLKDLAKA